MKKIVLLNSPILSEYGAYEYKKINLKEAIDIVNKFGYESAIGHESTSKVISTLLDIKCKVNRISYIQHPGEKALIFKLMQRVTEGKILTVEEIKKIGFTWGLLTRIK